MLSDGELLALAHMRHNIVLAMSFVDGLTYEQFHDDHKSFNVVTRALEIISEASRKLPAALKGRHPGLPWKDIAGAGSVYRHLEDRLRGVAAAARCRRGRACRRRSISLMHAA